MMDIRIEPKGKMPALDRARGKSKYPYGKLDIGRHFIYPAGTKWATARSTASKYGTRHGKKFTVLKTSNEIQCWRVK